MNVERGSRGTSFGSVTIIWACLGVVMWRLWKLVVRAPLMTSC